MKESWKPGTMIYPLPAVLVGCGDAPDNWNLLTVAWTGTVCTAPPMCYVSVRPERHSHALIARTGEFTINLTTAAMARAVDWCGVRSGRDYDKFRETGLTPLRGAVVAAPALEESPVVVECRRAADPAARVARHVSGRRVVNVLVDDRYIDSATGRFDLERAGLVAYSHGEYFRLGELIGHFGLVGSGAARSSSANEKAVTERRPSPRGCRRSPFYSVEARPFAPRVVTFAHRLWK